MAKTYRIHAAKIVGEHLNINYTIKEEDGTEGKAPSFTHDRAVHADLRNAFQALAPHLAILTGCIKQKQVNDPDLIKDFIITGFSIKDEVFVLKGWRKTENGTVTLNTPPIEFEGDYRLLEDLTEKLDAARDEAHEYLVNGKGAPKAEQAKIDFPVEGEGKEPEVNHMKIAAEMTDEEKLKYSINLNKTDDAGSVRESDIPRGSKSQQAKLRVAQTPDNPSGLKTSNG